MLKTQQQKTIVSDEQNILEQVNVSTDGSHFNRNKMEFAPQWLLHVAYAANSVLLYGYICFVGRFILKVLIL